MTRRALRRSESAVSLCMARRIPRRMDRVNEAWGTSTKPCSAVRDGFRAGTCHGSRRSYPLPADPCPTCRCRSAPRSSPGPGPVSVHVHLDALSNRSASRIVTASSRVVPALGATSPSPWFRRAPRACSTSVPQRSQADARPSRRGRGCNAGSPRFPFARTRIASGAPPDAPMDRGCRPVRTPS